MSQIKVLVRTESGRAMILFKRMSRTGDFVYTLQDQVAKKYEAVGREFNNVSEVEDLISEGLSIEREYTIGTDGY